MISHHRLCLTKMAKFRDEMCCKAYNIQVSLTADICTNYINAGINLGIAGDDWIPEILTECERATDGLSSYLLYYYVRCRLLPSLSSRSMDL